MCGFITNYVSVREVFVRGSSIVGLFQWLKSLDIYDSVRLWASSV